jgi:hypothetical protein
MRKVFLVPAGFAYDLSPIAMIRKIALKNFMAHEDTELELCDGVNVLVGPNNIGKSTVALALKILARNSNSSFVQRHESKESSVLVETSEGHSIQWIKRKSPSYLIDGQLKDRLGRGGTPPELDETLRLAAVEFEGKDFEPHFGDQKSPIFLIHHPPSHIAQFFSTTSDAEQLLAMQRLHQKKKSDLAVELKIIEEESVQLERILTALSPAEELARKWERLDAERQQLIQLEAEISKLRGFLSDWQLQQLDSDFEKKQIRALAGMTELPSFYPTESLVWILDQLESCDTSRSYTANQCRCLGKLISVPCFYDVRDLESWVSESLKTVDATKHWSSVSSTLSRLIGPPVILETTELELATKKLQESISTVNDSYRVSQVLQSLAAPTAEIPVVDLKKVLAELQLQVTQADLEQRKLDCLKSTPALPNLEDVESLQLLMASIQLHEKSLHHLNFCLNQLEKEFNSLELSIEQFLTADPTCPTCGSRLTADMLRSRRHEVHATIKDLQQ